MSRRDRWPIDTRPLEWAGREEFGRLRGQWMELVRRDADLLPAAKLTLAEIGARFSHDKSHAWPSFSRLAADVATSAKTIQRSVADGMSRGWLIIERVGFGASNRYILAASPRVVEQVEAAHGKRLTLLAENCQGPFRSPVSILDSALIQATGDLSLRTPVTSRSGQPRPVITDTGDQLILPKNPLTEADQETLTERLGDRVQDETPREHQCSIEDLRLLIGAGDLDLGRRRAARLGSSREQFLLEQVTKLGLVGAAAQIREAASIADAAEVAAQSSNARRDGK